METARLAWAQRTNRRKSHRVRIKLGGKIFLPELRHEFDCVVVDLSCGGARIRCKNPLPPRTKVVLYANGFGRFEGLTAQPTADGTRICFNCSARKRQRIEEQLTSFVKDGLKSETRLRGGTRVPYVGISNFVRPNGKVVECEVMDISLTGVSLKTTGRPPVNECIRVGRMLGRVTRHHETGIGVVFLEDLGSENEIDLLHAQDPLTSHPECGNGEASHV